MIQFQNSYAELPEAFYERVSPENFPEAELILLNEELARKLKIAIDPNELKLFFSGQKSLPGSDPLALAYAGYQFGHPVPQLGDGRAHLLGETQGYDIQVKGSGQTRFSRQGDGRSALGPVIREYIVSEAMHHLGIPTTRALAALKTNEMVYRQEGPEPGGVFVRVAESHLRVGTFQYFAFKEDIESIETLLNYTLKRHYPHLLKIDKLSERALEFLKELTLKQAYLIAQWTSVGFVHGVMNTDNFSVAGLTIDYGPCAFLDEFRYNKVFSSIDRSGRYSFFNQVPIAQWNILRLADCLLPLIDENIEKAIERVDQELTEIFPQFELKRWEALASKMGLNEFTEKDIPLIKNFLDFLERHELDYTLSFRYLPDLYNNQSSFYPDSPELDHFLSSWKTRGPKVENLNSINPLYIARNHQVERAIRECYNNNTEVFFELVQLLKQPFQEQPELKSYIKPPLPQERITETFCGT